jgi:hypothetical protein
MNGAIVMLSETLTSGPRFSGGSQGALRLGRRATQRSTNPMFPGRSEAKYNLSPSAEIAGEKSARGPRIGSGRRSGAPQASCSVERVVTQMSESGLSKVVERLKYSVLPSAEGVGNASNASVLISGPRFSGGSQGRLGDCRLVTYRSELPKPPGRCELKYSAFPSFDSRNALSSATGSLTGDPRRTASPQGSSFRWRVDMNRSS